MPDIQAELDRQHSEGKFVSVEHIRPHAPMQRYTTPELLTVEREIIERVRAGVDHPSALAAVARAEIDQRFSPLNEDQRRLVHEALVNRDQIYGIQGGAGTGKATAIRAIRSIAEEYGYEPFGLGPTSRATKGLKEAGMEAETLQLFLTRGENAQLVRPARRRTMVTHGQEPETSSKRKALGWGPSAF